MRGQPPVDIQQLKTFLEVCKTRHFGHAAQNLYLTQSAVSFRIRQLETQLGTPLFNRHRNNLQLTHAGERLKVHAETIITTWQRAQQEVSSRDDQHRALTLGASANIWSAWLGEALGELHERFPDVLWRADTLTGDLMVRRLLERTLDLAVLTDPPKVDELKTVALQPLTLVMAAPAGADIERALTDAYVLVDWGTRFMIDHAKRFAHSPSPVLHTGDARLAMAFVRRHQGSAFLPTSLLDAEPDDWQRIDSYGEMHKTLYLAHHAHHPDLDSLSPVIDCLVRR
ncbi:LysR family transcriptional regulator [Saccharospirillum salsuginis]|uniref:LysR family transcriptional regulator n=1 Tax=Saccharospirillum salsuginis TaxID=418750 RepID=UPI001676E685|nr:LysR family transcriptional regulator [Saccharospirillum salsuginis]